MCQMLWRHGVKRPIRENNVHIKEPVLIIDADVKTEQENQQKGSAENEQGGQEKNGEKDSEV